MSKKAFLVSVDVEIQTITCPGVWLCSNGKVSLQMHMLDSYVQTESYKPIFPIVLMEKYNFRKVFHKETRLNELQRSLYDQWIYLEFIQWENCEDACVLATFQTTLDDLLFPTSLKGCVAGVNLELLLEPSKIFPGTIGPKVQINTKTTIKQTVCDLNLTNSSVSNVVNPKLLLSDPSVKNRTRSRRVCHSIGYSRAKKRFNFQKASSRPPFQYRRAEDDLLAWKPSEKCLCGRGQKLRKDFSQIKDIQLAACYCCSQRSKSVEGLEESSKKFQEPLKFSPKHLNEICPVCSKYNFVFCATSEHPSKKSFCHHHEETCCRSRSRNSPIFERAEDDKTCCFCIDPSKPRSLAEKLHKRLSETLQVNSRLLRGSCMRCEEYL